MSKNGQSCQVESWYCAVGGEAWGQAFNAKSFDQSKNCDILTPTMYVLHTDQVHVSARVRGHSAVTRRPHMTLIKQIDWLQSDLLALKGLPATKRLLVSLCCGLNTICCVYCEEQSALELLVQSKYGKSRNDTRQRLWRKTYQTPLLKKPPFPSCKHLPHKQLE